MKNRNWRYHKTRSRSVSNIGKNTGISVIYLGGDYFVGECIVMDV